MVRHLPSVVVIVAIASLAGCSGGSNQAGQKPGRGEYIVYSVSPSILTSRQMFRIRPDGTEKVAMTNPADKSNDEPAFNSDGNTIVFSSSRDFLGATQSFGPRLLYKTSIDGTIQTRVTANSPVGCTEYGGHFSADDRMITFIAACDPSAGVRNLPFVHRINADGSGQVRVVPDHPALAVRHTFAAFAPNNRIVFAVDLGGDDIGNPQPPRVDLFAMDADGKNTQRLTNLAVEGRTILDSISVFRDSVYFVTVSANEFNHGQLETIKVDGTGRTVLFGILDISTSGGRPFPQDSQFTLSPDGHSIAFVRHDLATGKQVLMTSLMDGTSATAIDSSGIAATPAWK